MSDRNPSRPRLTLSTEAGVYRLPEIGIRALEAEAAILGAACVHIDLGACTDKTSLLRSIAVALHFPDWFGYNWDALADCLNDLSWLPGTGHVIILNKLAPLIATAPRELETALQILDETARERALRGDPLWVFADFPPPHPPWLRAW